MYDHDSVSSLIAILADLQTYQKCWNPIRLLIWKLLWFVYLMFVWLLLLERLIAAVKPIPRGYPTIPGMFPPVFQDRFVDAFAQTYTE